MLLMLLRLQSGDFFLARRKHISLKKHVLSVHFQWPLCYFSQKGPLQFICRFILHLKKSVGEKNKSIIQRVPTPD